MAITKARVSSDEDVNGPAYVDLKGSEVKGAGLCVEVNGPDGNKTVIPMACWREFVEVVEDHFYAIYKDEQ